MFPSFVNFSVQLYADSDPEYNSVEGMQIFMSGHPAGTSKRNLLRWQQLVESGEFRKFDYEEDNLTKYGLLEPPSINLSKIKVPVALFCGLTDKLSNMKDAKWARDQLTSL
jgi:hypothetical protein